MEKKRQKYGGRQKGTPNKMTKTALEAISYAADALGGPERLTAWAQEDPANEKIFWGTIYPKLLPLKLTGDPDQPLAIQEITRKIIK